MTPKTKPIPLPKIDDRAPGAVKPIAIPRIDDRAPGAFKPIPLPQIDGDKLDGDLPSTRKS